MPYSWSWSALGSAAGAMEGTLLEADVSRLLPRPAPLSSCSAIQTSDRCQSMPSLGEWWRLTPPRGIRAPVAEWQADTRHAGVTPRRHQRHRGAMGGASASATCAHPGPPLYHSPQPPRRRPQAFPSDASRGKGMTVLTCCNPLLPPPSLYPPSPIVTSVKIKDRGKSASARSPPTFGSGARRFARTPCHSAKASSAKRELVPWVSFWDYPASHRHGAWCISLELCSTSAAT